MIARAPPWSVPPWKQICIPEVLFHWRFVLSTPSWHALEFLRLSHVWSLPIRKGCPRRTPSQHANGQPFVQASCRRMSLQLWHNCSATVGRLARIIGMQSAPACPVGWHTVHCAARDLPTREAMKRDVFHRLRLSGVDLQDVARTLPAGSTNQSW